MHIIRYICKTCSIRKILFAFMIIFSIIPTLCIYMLFKTYTINIVADKYINEYLMSLSSQIDYEFSSFENRLTSNYLYISLSPENLRCAESGKNTENMLRASAGISPYIKVVSIGIVKNVNINTNINTLFVLYCFDNCPVILYSPKIISKLKNMLKILGKIIKSQCKMLNSILYTNASVTW